MVKFTNSKERDQESHHMHRQGERKCTDGQKREGTKYLDYIGKNFWGGETLALDLENPGLRVICARWGLKSARSGRQFSFLYVKYVPQLFVPSQKPNRY